MLEEKIKQARGNAAALEKLYRKAMAAEEENAFKNAIAQGVKEYPEDALFSAWAYRLEILPLESAGVSIQTESWQWWVAIGISIVLGILYVLSAGNKPPVPIPSQSNPLFWIGWGPLTALAILFYLAVVDSRKERISWYGISATVVILVTLFTAWIVWRRTDAIANLAAIHLPFVVWAAVGGSVALGHSDAAKQFFGFIVKSVETVLTAGIYLGAGIIFSWLTFGIFSVLGIKFSESLLRTIVAWGTGVVPILALASVYNPSSSPAEQNWTTGLARILRIITRLLLPLALGVLAVYIFWFVPNYFWRPFRQREILIVYNATIMAIVVLLACAVPGSEEKRSLRYDQILRYAVLVTGALTVLFNVYAFAAIVSRTLTSGLTPNRHAVLGWNIVTLLVFAVVVIKAWRSKPDEWADAFRKSMALVFLLAIGWSLWVLFGIPICTSFL